MRRTLIVLAAVGGIAAIGVALFIDRSGSCDVLAERDLFDVIMDFDESGAKPTMEEAAEAAFAEAGIPRRVDATDFDPIIRAHPDGNLIHLGVDGYWVELATTQDGAGFRVGRTTATLFGIGPFHLTASSCGYAEPMDLTDWIEGYRKAWEAGDTELVLTLFTEEASYRSNPFEEPHVGHDGIRAYWIGVTSQQRDAIVKMGRPFVDGNRVAVEWWTTMVSEGEEVTLPGCLLLRFEPDGRCSDLREYWNFAPGTQDPFEDWGT